MTAYSIIRTKAGRASIIKQVEDLCATSNLTLHVEHEDPRSVYVQINHGGHYVMFHLEPRILPDACVLSWFSRDGAKYPASFIGGDVNRFHYGKATSVVGEVEDLLATIRNGFEQLQAIEAPLTTTT